MSKFFDIATPTEYMSRNMFLDAAGPVTVHRFDEVKYPKYKAYEETQRGFIWTPEEISLSADRQQIETASEAEIHIFTSNLLRQTTLDSAQGKLPSIVFAPIASLPEIEELCLTWGVFEGVIHNRSYAHIILEVFRMSKEMFNQIHDTAPIVKMAASIGRYYDDLYRANCLAEVGMPVPIKEHKKKIWLALHASYALEAIRFRTSFSTSLGMAMNGKFIGNGNIITLIQRDELLHVDWSADLIRDVQDDPDFREMARDPAIIKEVEALYMDAWREEVEWAQYLTMKGSTVGLTANMLSDYASFMTKESLDMIGVRFLGNSPKSNPFPWMERMSDIGSRQSALQENESVDYTIGVLKGEVELDQLPRVML